MKNNIKRLAFSLVELMISLITISLITAALAPVITKKLSAGTITVGSFGGGSATSTYTGEPRSQADCDKISTSLMFISSADSGNPKNLCVTRYNIGDHADLQIPTSAVPAGNIFSAGSGDSKCKADYTTPCCWTGNTAGGTCDSANGSYSGCNRTVCNWQAASNICAQLNVNGQSGFRLPTKDELGNLNPDKFSKSTSAYAGDNGLMFCDHYAGYNSARCSRTEVCPGSCSGNCNPYDVWSGMLDGSSSAFDRLLNSGSWRSDSSSRTGPLSTRCVIDNITISETSGGGGSSSVDMGSVKKTVCDMFDTKYWDEGEKSCKTCSEDIPNCERCSNGSTCEKCVSGYQLVDGKCSATKCPRATMQIGDLCVTQYNIGDHDNYRLPNANSVDYLLGVYNAGSGDSACKANYTTGCCWRGATSGTYCDSVNGSYSGCNRTVCNWWAANGLCNNITIEGFSGWRLPTKEELGNFNPNTYSKSNSPNPGDNGLMFCDYYAGYNSARCSHAEVCPGSYDGSCRPRNVWSGTLDGSTSAFDRGLTSGSWGSASGYRTHTLSVRCVIDMCKLNYQNCQTCANEGCSLCNEGYYLVNGYCKKLTTVPNCLTYSSTEDKCTTCKTGFVLENNQCTQKFTCTPDKGLVKFRILSKDLCITQYNIGDHANYPLPDPNTVDYLRAIYNAGSGDSACSANYTTGCCWKGNTAGTDCDSANGSYSGCNRTVCNWYAADNICKNLNILGETGWRLPTSAELEQLNPDTYSKSTSPYPGDNGLMFCDYYANYNSARCTRAEVCPGSCNGRCYPDYVWSGTLDGSAYVFYRYLTSGSWNSISGHRTHTLSVRCIKEL